MTTAPLEPGEIWSDRLSPTRNALWQQRTGQTPAQWPIEMREGLAKLAETRTVHCGEDIVELMAEWIVLNPA